jgi:sigma-B regulation protein RsbU (phosphoserine phosphatase)
MSSLEAFATQAALAIESARLYADSAEKARIDRDLRIAADIQRALLPKAPASGRRSTWPPVSVPCRTVGGDFYDYVDVERQRVRLRARRRGRARGRRRRCWPAVVQSNFGALATVTHEPAEMMLRLNRRCCGARSTRGFATDVLRRCDAVGRVQLLQRRPGAAARHRKNGIRWLEIGGPVLGLLPSAKYEYATEQLEPGDSWWCAATA